ncbi:preprotein translocase subunit YajC [Streptomyces sp. DH12]|uniref:preprotein translocase subunit YajC n=1 Tax=Streptomyces sp. DH12 TaxID=2857010 RepID=UPI001E353DAB|nr:preprotein translocase subunit YajC [Streptomyces sp. DH12]
MDILTLLPFIVLIGAMFLMTRSAKKKQQQAAEMRNQMQPGTGVRTIGGMYATVKEVGDDTVLLEVAPGVHAVYAKNAIGAVLDDDEYNRIVHGDTGADAGDGDLPVVPDDASSLVPPADAGDTAAASGDTDDTAKPDLTKKTDADDTARGDVKDGKTDGEGDAK